MSGYVALARVLPVRFGGRRALLLIERNVLVYRSAWLMILSGFFEPFFYLLAIGLGIGGMVGDITLPDGTTMSYAMFVAPALLASSSMNGAVTESTFNVFFKLNFQKVYDAVLATPLAPGDVALGEIGWAVIRAGMYAAGFMVVILVMGLVWSPWAVLVVPAAVLMAFAFAALGMAATTFMRSWQDFDLINLVILPLFLFSGTFFPITSYPEWLQVVVRLTPLWQGTDLIRQLTTGYVDLGILWHVLYLGAVGLVGLVVVGRRLDRMLLK
jgi:lipooligosaccharide transport system permease protein